MAQVPADGPDFESAMQELEKIVAGMESGAMSLEDSLVAYKRGAELVRLCQEKLAGVEQQVKILDAELLKPFDESA
jgi:exodeoxyribonuclease VII small subunit